MTIAIGTKEHSSHVCTTACGVGVRIFFVSSPRPNTSKTPMTWEMMEQLAQKVRRQVTKDLRCACDRRWKSMSPHHIVVHPDQMNPYSTKDSCVVEDEDELHITFQGL